MKHLCHWPGCGKAIPPRMWGCLKHWRQLPAEIQHEIWRTFRPGQEVDKRPSADYLAAAMRARTFALERGAC